jgi:transcriptional regulator with XRE-family HTH domain
MNLILKMSILQKFPHQGDFAREVGVSESLVSRIVNGRRFPTEEQAEKIAKVLALPVDELFPAAR